MGGFTLLLHVSTHVDCSGIVCVEFSQSRSPYTLEISLIPRALVFLLNHFYLRTQNPYFSSRCSAPVLILDHQRATCLFYFYLVLIVNAYCHDVYLHDILLNLMNARLYAKNFDLYLSVILNFNEPVFSLFLFSV